MRSTVSLRHVHTNIRPRTFTYRSWSAHPALNPARPQHQQTLVSEAYRILFIQASSLLLCVCVCVCVCVCELQSSVQVRNKGLIVWWLLSLLWKTPKRATPHESARESSRSAKRGDTKWWIACLNGVCVFIRTQHNVCGCGAVLSVTRTTSLKSSPVRVCVCSHSSEECSV